MQYEQVAENKRLNLPKPSIDTGMGIERIAMLLYQIEDIRILYENDIRFNSQFKDSI